jgi:hypothetical protein
MTNEVVFCVFLLCSKAFCCMYIFREVILHLTIYNSRSHNVYSQYLKSTYIYILICTFHHLTPGFNLISLFFFSFQKFDVLPPRGLVKTCGKPNIQNIMNNVTVRPGQSASFKCQVDMSCIVAYIEWYHEMDNGTEKLIKVRSKEF